jgi:hypothetical protein
MFSVDGCDTSSTSVSHAGTNFYNFIQMYLMSPHTASSQVLGWWMPPDMNSRCELLNT